MSTSWPDILTPLDNSPRERARLVLSDLAYYARGRYSLVGGLPIRYYLVKAGVPLRKRDFNDIDLIAEGPWAFHPSLVERFLIHHFHDSAYGRDFRFVLVHKATDVKVDIFNELPLNGPVGLVPFGRTSLPIQTLESQLAKTIFDLHTMHKRAPIDPKQFADAEALMLISDIDLAEKMWQQQVPVGPSLLDAWSMAAERAAANPDTVGAKPWQSKPPYKCEKCYPESPDWPLAEMDEIYSRLGYVELDGPDISQ